MRVILADAELELVPEQIAGHPAIRRAAESASKKPTALLLDANTAPPAVKQLEDGARRGRPDITHISLLNLLGSPLCRRGDLSVTIHTRHGDCITVRPDTRLPRGESRFQGVMARVLATGQSQDKNPLIVHHGRMGAAKVLAMEEGPAIRLDEHGETGSFASVAAAKPSTVVIGAFPSGDFSDAWKKAVPDAVSCFDQPLEAWVVAAELCAAMAS